MTLSLRPATAQDAKLIWEWANDPTVRALAFNPEPIPWESHTRWYEQRLASPGTRFWVLEMDGGPAGQIRYDRDADGRVAEISLSVAPAHRGKGFGVELIRRTCGPALDELGVRVIVAWVFQDNRASQRAFERAGFKKTGLRPVRGQACYQFIWPADAAEAE